MAAKKSEKRIFSDGGEHFSPPHPQGGYDQKAPNGAGGYSYSLNGWPHRLDGPAVTWMDGTELRYREGKLHCENGPARIHPNGHRAWFNDGVQIREEGKPTWEPLGFGGDNDDPELAAAAGPTNAPRSKPGGTAKRKTVGAKKKR